MICVDGCYYFMWVMLKEGSRAEQSRVEGGGGRNETSEAWHAVMWFQGRKTIDDEKESKWNKYIMNYSTLYKQSQVKSSHSLQLTN
jgi:hypothetical protein